MQTVNRRRFSFLGQHTAAVAAGVAIATGLLMGGCSSAPSARAPMPVGSMAARDAAGDFAVQPGILSMASGDRLGMAVYARKIELARAEAREKHRLTAQPAAARESMASVSTDE